MNKNQNKKTAQERYHVVKLKGFKDRVVYIYQNEDGDVFNCSASTLEECREKRDRWQIHIYNRAQVKAACDSLGLKMMEKANTGNGGTYIVSGDGSVEIESQGRSIFVPSFPDCHMHSAEEYQEALAIVKAKYIE